MKTERSQITVQNLSARLLTALALTATFGMVIIGIATFLFTMTSTRLSDPEYQIIPGRNQVLLDFAEGKKIMLKQDSQGIALAQGYVKYASNALKIQPLKVKEQLTLSTSCGALYQLLLPDGTKVWLNSASSIKFPATFTGMETRRVQLTGEAYFEVAKTRSPFTVVTKGQEITVLGTHFNVYAYPDEAIRTTLLEGSISVTPLPNRPISPDPGLLDPLTLMRSGTTTILKPNQQAIVQKLNISVKTVDAQESVAWKKGDFIFRNTPLKNIMLVLSRWYDVQVVYQKGSRADKKILGGIISRSTAMTEVLKSLELIAYVHFNVTGRTITVMD